jgi:tetratricopeptide (TPR) repeat protein
MAAQHYVEALKLAEAAGIDAEPLRGGARTALAEASERAANLGSWSDAVDRASQALALCPPGDPLRPSLELRIAAGRAFGPEADLDLECVASARDGAVSNRDFETATEAEALLSWMHWWRGEGEQARSHRDRALELAAELPASPGKLRAHAQAARLEAIGGDPKRAVELSDAALELAEELGRDDIRSNALNSRGIARAHLGDAGGVADLEQAVELADRSGAAIEMTIARNNCGAVLEGYGRLAEARDILVEAIDLAARYGTPGGGQWAEMHLVLFLRFAGQLEEAAAALRDLDERVAPETQLKALLDYCTGWILAVRGEIAEALPLLEQMLDSARRSRDSQAVAPALCGLALVHCLAGREAKAEPAIRELLTTPGYTHPSYATHELVLLLADRGREDEMREALRTSPAESAWTRAHGAVVSGDLAVAAERYGAMGAHFLEAWARLVAAERGDLAQLEPAHAFFAGVGAKPTRRPAGCSPRIRSRSSSASRSTSRSPSSRRSPGRCG